MPAELHPSTPDDLPRIIDFLAAVFGTSPASPHLDPKLLRWKYYEEGPPWKGSRSLMLRDGDRLLAHGCAWPFPVKTAGSEYPAVCLVDWASGKTPPGMGVALVRKLAAMSPLIFSIAGSEMTRQIMPRIGFPEFTQLALYARVLRPTRQMAVRPDRKGWKEPLRWARNTTWSMRSIAPLGKWTAHFSAAPETEVVDAVARAPVTYPTATYDTAFLQFMLRCPAGDVRYYSLRKAGQAQGYLLLMFHGPQCRLLALRLANAAQDDWNAACALSVQLARQESDVCELIALASTPELDTAMLANGFQWRDRRPVFVHDPRKLITAHPSTLDLTMLDDDTGYLFWPEHPFVT